MTEIENLRAENVELVKCVKEFMSIMPINYKDFPENLKAHNMAKQALSDSPSAKWLEAVENVIEATKGFRKIYPELLTVSVASALAELDALEKEGK